MLELSDRLRIAAAHASAIMYMLDEAAASEEPSNPAWALVLNEVARAYALLGPHIKELRELHSDD